MASESNPNRGAQLLRLRAALEDSQALARRVIDPLTTPAQAPEDSGGPGARTLTRRSSLADTVLVRVHLIEPKP